VQFFPITCGAISLSLSIPLYGRRDRLHPVRYTVCFLMSDQQRSTRLVMKDYKRAARFARMSRMTAPVGGKKEFEIHTATKKQT